jgi:hypothetical protein
MEISKQVVDREKSAAQVVAAARGHKEKAGAGVASLLGAAHGNAAKGILAAAADKLEQKARAMVAADEAHVAELGDDAQNRTARDEKTAALRAVFVDLRDLATTMYGPAYVAALGYEGATPEDPVMLKRLGERIVAKLDTVARPAPRFEGMTFDPAPWKAKIAAPLAVLGTSLDAVAAESRQAEETLTAKARAIADYDDVFSKTAGLVSALLRVAGEEELADRVRPVKSRPGRTADTATEAAATSS